MAVDLMDVNAVYVWSDEFTWKFQILEVASCEFLWQELVQKDVHLLDM